MLGDNRDLAVGWIQPPRVQESETACGRDIETEALVAVVGWANVETISGMGGPPCTSGWVIEDKCFCAKWCMGYLIKIKCPVEFLIHQDSLVAPGKTQ